MDKIDLLIDAIDHPERYTSEQLAQLASDAETAELYRTLCRTRSSAFATEIISGEEISQQWARFEKTSRRKTPLIWKIGRRAAIWTAVAIASVSAVAVGVSISMTRLSEKTPDMEESAPAAIAAAEELPETTGKITVKTETGPVIFDGEKLQTVIDRMAAHYGVKVKYKSDAAKEIKLFYRWDCNQPLPEIIDDLNTFERIHVSLKDNVLIVD